MTWTLNASGHTNPREGETTWEAEERELARAIAAVLKDKGGYVSRFEFNGNHVQAKTLDEALGESIPPK
jgi:hypothetical protein